MAATRRIFAFGGGHYGQHRDTYDREKPEGGYWPLDTKPVDDLIVAAAGVDAPNVLVVTTASEDGRRKADLLYEANQRRWGAYGAATQVLKLFTKRDAAARHLDGGAPRVLVSAPCSGADATFVVGVNDDQFDPEVHTVVSNASCTTNCFVPMVKVLDDAFGVDRGLQCHRRAGQGLLQLSEGQ